MDTYLTEIKNAHLFMEYLHSVGLKTPKSRKDNWEIVEKERVLARIKKDLNGNAQFFICAALLGKK